jgi:hypothetical protein
VTGSQLRILTGLEIGEPHWHGQAVAAVLAAARFDRLLGSLHCLPTENGFTEPPGHYRQQAAADVVRHYLAEVWSGTGDQYTHTIATFDPPAVVARRRRRSGHLRQRRPPTLSRGRWLSRRSSHSRGQRLPPRAKPIRTLATCGLTSSTLADRNGWTVPHPPILIAAGSGTPKVCMATRFPLEPVAKG